MSNGMKDLWSKKSRPTAAFLEMGEMSILKITSFKHQNARNLIQQSFIKDLRYVHF